MHVCPRMCLYMYTTKCLGLKYRNCLACASLAKLLTIRENRKKTFYWKTAHSRKVKRLWVIGPEGSSYVFINDHWVCTGQWPDALIKALSGLSRLISFCLSSVHVPYKCNSWSNHSTPTSLTFYYLLKTCQIWVIPCQSSQFAARV